MIREADIDLPRHDASVGIDELVSYKYTRDRRFVFTSRSIYTRMRSTESVPPPFLSLSLPRRGVAPNDDLIYPRESRSSKLV